MTEESQRYFEPGELCYLDGGENDYKTFAMPLPKFPAIAKIPAGYYRADTLGDMPATNPLSYVFNAMAVLSTVEMLAPTKTQSAPVEYLLQFLTEDTRKKYEKMNLLWKTGIMLSGPPGTGKTFAINEMIAAAVAADAVVLHQPKVPRLSTVVKAARLTDETRTVVAVYDDCERPFGDFEYAILHYLDGQESISNFIMIAATNNLAAIPVRIWQRPSRFSRIFYFDYAEAEDVSMYLSARCSKVLSKEQIGILSHACSHYKLTMDEIKHIAIAYVITNMDVNEILESRYKDRKKFGKMQEIMRPDDDEQSELVMTDIATA